jgi:hypothetical protein
MSIVFIVNISCFVNLLLTFLNGPIIASSFFSDLFNLYFKRTRSHILDIDFAFSSLNYPTWAVLANKLWLSLRVKDILQIRLKRWKSYLSGF